MLTLGLAVFASPSVSAQESSGEPTTEAQEEGPSIPWVRDVAEAKKQAKAEGKDLFINFTGSDWCGWCIRLDEEVFSKAEFVEAATQKYVFLFLDFPNSEELKAKVVDEKLNRQLSKAYGVDGYPAVILTTAEGQPYARTGYQAGGPKAYLESLTKLHEGGKAIKALLADTNHKNVDALVAAFPVLAEQELLSYPAYEWTLDAAAKADPDGKLNLLPVVKKEKERLLAKAEFQQLQSLFPKNRKEKPDFDKIVAFIVQSKHIQGGDLLGVGFPVTGMLIQEKQFGNAQKMIDRLATDPLMESNPRAKQALQGMKEQLEKKQEEATEEGESDKE